MDREWLKEQLEAGRSMEAIAREVGKSASTVAYWVNKHGLVSVHVARHAPKGKLDEDVLRELVEAGLSVRQIAKRLDRSAAAVRHWLRRFGLKTQPASRVPAGSSDTGAVMRECPHHGWVARSRDSQGYFRCVRCRSERVSRRRREVKEMLVAEAGGRCVRCGYDEYIGALQFHHRDPATKRFEIGGRGLTRALAELRDEAAKCALLCANCHAAIGAGAATLPPPGASVPGSPVAG